MLHLRVEKAVSYSKLSFDQLRKHVGCDLDNGIQGFYSDLWCDALYAAPYFVIPDIFRLSEKEVKQTKNNGNKPYAVIAIVILYAWQILNFWTHQDLINHYLECRQENVELRQKVLELRREVLELHKDILEPLEEIQDILESFESQ